jgi:hypothetical protein
MIGENAVRLALLRLEPTCPRPVLVAAVEGAAKIVRHLRYEASSEATRMMQDVRQEGWRQ